MSISVYTQYMENYGEAEGANYWKFKWGMKYIVEGTDERPANAVATVMHYIAQQTTNLHYSMEYVRRWIHTHEELDETAGLEPYTTLQYNARPIGVIALQYTPSI